jgi:hypothetical protein
MSQVKILGDASGTGVFEIASPNSNTSYTLTLPQTSGTLYVPGTTVSAIQSETAVSASSTAVNFSNIPSWVKRITVMWYELSSNGVTDFYVQLGTSGGLVSTGYVGNSTALSNAAAVNVGTVTFGLKICAITSSGNSTVGQAIISKLTGNTWVMTSNSRVGNSDTTLGSSSIALGGTLTQLSVVTGNGTDTFDAGSINILYE